MKQHNWNICDKLLKVSLNFSAIMCEPGAIAKEMKYKIRETVRYVGWKIVWIVLTLRENFFN